MKKICFLVLLSATVIAQKNYSQTLDQHIRKPIPEPGLYDSLLVINPNKINTPGICRNRPDGFVDMPSKKHHRLSKNYKKTEWINTGFLFSVGSFYPTVEDLYKWKWEQAMKGTIFSY